jgi:hypothetical protein
MFQTYFVTSISSQHPVTLPFAFSPPLNQLYPLILHWGTRTRYTTTLQHHSIKSINLLEFFPVFAVSLVITEVAVYSWQRTEKLYICSMSLIQLCLFKSCYQILFSFWYSQGLYHSMSPFVYSATCWNLALNPQFHRMYFCQLHWPHLVC